MNKKIPITIITGFLGVGKTTLLLNLLNNNVGKKIAVIVNEFGDVGVDGDILESGCGCPSEDIVELSNGCICCTVQEEFLPTMQQLLEKKEELDHIVIETSGLALPKPLVKAVNWPDLKPHITVDAVITVVDASGIATGEICDRDRVQKQREQDDSLDHETPIEELFEDQLNCADLVVITKKDLVEPEQFEEVKTVVSNRLRDHVQIISAIQGDVPLEVLVGYEKSVEDDLDNRPSHHDHHHHDDDDHGHDHHHHDHEHDDSIGSIGVRVNVSHTPDSLEKALGELYKSHTVYRTKGFIDVAAKPMRMVLQGVGSRIQTYFDRAWKEGEDRQTYLVLIGQDLDQSQIEKDLINLLENNN